MKFIIDNQQIEITDVKQLLELANQHPQEAEVFIQNIMKHPGEFKRLTKNLDDFLLLRDRFQAHSNQLTQYADEMLAQPALESYNKFIEVINHISRLLLIAEIFPQHIPQLSKFLRNHPEVFKEIQSEKNSHLYLLYQNSYLTPLIDTFPLIANVVINNVLSSSQEFKKFVLFDRDIYEVSIKYPVLANKLIEYLIENREHFIRLIKIPYDNYVPSGDNSLLSGFYKRFYTLKKMKGKFPIYANALMQATDKWLIQPALESPEKFQELIKTNLGLCEIVQEVPQSARALLEYLKKNPAEFQRLVGDNHELYSLAKYLPKDVADSLILFVLKNPTELDRLIRDDIELTNIAKLFPHIKELQKGSLKEMKEAIDARKSSAKIFSYARRICKWHQDKDSLFRQLVDGANIEIAAFMGTNGHDANDAIKTAMEGYMSAPVNLPPTNGHH